MNNKRIARLLEEAADLLQEQGANRYRVSAFRRAADTVRTLHSDSGIPGGTVPAWSGKGWLTGRLLFEPGTRLKPRAHR